MNICRKLLASENRGTVEATGWDDEPTENSGLVGQMSRAYAQLRVENKIGNIPFEEYNEEDVTGYDILMLTDLHVGQKVNPEDVENFNFYDSREAQTRMARLAAGVTKYK